MRIKPAQKDADAARRALAKQLDADKAAPARKTLDEAIELFLTDKASNNLTLTC